MFGASKPSCGRVGDRYSPPLPEAVHGHASPREAAWSLAVQETLDILVINTGD